MSADNKTSLFDFLNDVSHLKKGILSEENESDLSTYMLNRFLSMNITTIMYANEMNKNPHLPKQMVYDYYFHALKKQKRHFKYVKHTKQDIIDVIKEYHGYSEQFSKQIVDIFSPSDVEYMKSKLDKGGVKNERKKK